MHTELPKTFRLRSSMQLIELEDIIVIYVEMRNSKSLTASLFRVCGYFLTGIMVIAFRCLTKWERRARYP